MGKQADFYVTKDSIVNKVTKSEILFRGIKTSSGDQTANLKSIQGLSTWVLDEAEELTDEDKFDTINLSVREEGVQNRVILIMNPTTKEHWVYKKFFEARGVKAGTNDTIDDVNYIHTTYLDNKENLSDSFISDVERLKESNPTKYNHKILGGWLDKAEGVVFNNWEFGDFNPNNLQTSFGLDFGFSVDPDALVEVAIDKSKKIIYLKEQLYKNGLQLNELASLINSKTQRKLIIADSAEPRLIADLKARGCNIKPVKKGTIESGITLMLDYKIVISKESTNLAKELNNYTYLDKGSKLYIDDWNHCFVGDTLIETKKGQVKIKDIEEGCLVLTSKGYNRVLKKFNNGLKKVNKYSMQFDTFSLSLTATPEHKIKTQKGWIKIKDLTTKDTLYLNKFLTEKNTNFIKTKDTFLEGVKECIQTCGNIIKGIYQRDITFTTLTEILKTIGLKTLAWLKSLYTLDTRVKRDLMKTPSGLKNFTQKELKQLKNGTSQKKVKNGIPNMEKKHGETENTKLKIVKNVVKNTKPGIQENHCIAIKTAKLKQIDVSESKEMKVYDLMVENCHEYFANGILVHNCMDAIRYNVTYQLDSPNKGKYFVY